MEKRVGLVATEVWLYNMKCLKLAEDNKKFDKHILLFTGGKEAHISKLLISSKLNCSAYCWPKEQKLNTSSMIYFHLGSHSRKLAFLLIVVQQISFLYLACIGLGWTQSTKATSACLKYN